MDEFGNAVMVDVSKKDVTERCAVAVGRIRMSPACFGAVKRGAVKKGDVLHVAQLAGIMGAKKTSELIPLSHLLNLTNCKVTLSMLDDTSEIEAVCTVKCTGQTGVEMEALTGVSVSLLTVYDMCKALDKRMEMHDIHLVEKSGGKSGDFRYDGEKNERRIWTKINYMRISVTDRCDLRCFYCMPSALPCVKHNDVLRYEEILRICRAALELGIDRFKITGGEPFVRKGAADFVSRLKAEPGVRSVTVTTNGTHLSKALPQLRSAGIDGVNISLDAIDEKKYRAITKVGDVRQILSAIEECADSGIKTKVNCVLLDCNEDQIIPLVSLAQRMPVDVRFIELMPIGYGREQNSPDCGDALNSLLTVFPDLHPVNETRGNGPAVYYGGAHLQGRIGFIGACSHRFCSACNRIRLTSTGLSKPCLCYDAVTDLRALLRSGATDDQLLMALADVISNKPAAHCFSDVSGMTEISGNESDRRIKMGIIQAICRSDQRGIQNTYTPAHTLWQIGG
jgi:cyclic pyranopterin phosphate synthase